MQSRPDDLHRFIAPGFFAMLLDELKKLEVFNCARYRLTMPATQAWIDANRPH